jgi:hypothetical protein
MSYFKTSESEMCSCGASKRRCDNVCTPCYTKVLQRTNPEQYCKCGKWKRPQYDKCYECKFPSKPLQTGAVAPTGEVVKAAAPLPLTKEELLDKQLRDFDTSTVYGPRLNTKRSNRYRRAAKLGLIDDPVLFDLVQRTEHMYEFDHYGVLVKKQKK